RAMDLAQGHVDRYAEARRSGKLVAPALRRPVKTGKVREPRGVTDGTLDSDFRWLSSLFNWARKHRVNGRPLLMHNPLHGLVWPREQNVRDRKSTRLNSSHVKISYAVFCLKKK